ncbi:deaminase [Sphaerisporangium sp. NPDC051017]|uniref:deaminase n=1 Tax=Sphaerisporangium sp. NPDC051017 TaxID=3154636 RepID=UPI00341211A3
MTPNPPEHDTEADLRWLNECVELSRRCPRSFTAFAVGSVIVGGEGDVLATGYSRETAPHDHAEEAALAKLAPDDPRLATATIYTSLEPCTTRASRPRSCTALILAAGIPRVVYAWQEPTLFAYCTGTETLRQAGVEVIEISELAPDARKVNAHLFNA